MANCVNKSLPEFKALQKETGLHSEVLAAKIGVWQDNNGSDQFPEVEKLYTSQTVEETIYYHKNENFEVKEKDYISQITNSLYDLASDRSLISEKKYKGKRRILHTYKNSNSRAYKTVKAREEITNENFNRLTNLNNAHSNGNLPYIIEEIAPTKDGIPNYTVEVNPDFLDVEWTKLKEGNREEERLVEEGNIAGKQLKMFEGYVEQKNTEIDLEYDTLDEINAKVSMLSAAFNNAGMEVSVEMNADLPKNVYGRVKGKKIEINPRYAKKDTVIHEFGHIFIDALGGMSNNFIKRGRKLLEGSKIESEVIKEYSKGDDAIEGEVLDKEILVTAIGIEGSKLYDERAKSPFLTWLKIFLNKVRLTLGLNGNVALELANQMLTDKIKKNKLTNESFNIWQYSKAAGNEKSVSEEESRIELLINKIYDRINILKAKYDKTGNDTFKKNVSELLEDLENLRDDKGLIRYVEEALSQSEKINTRLSAIYYSDESINPQNLNAISTYSGAFNLLPEVSKAIESEIRKATKAQDTDRVEMLSDQLDKIDKANSLIKRNQSLYDNVQLEYLAQLMTPHSNRMKFEKKEEYTREYYRLYGRKDKEAKDKYVENKLIENAKEIAALEEDHVKKILGNAPRDITSTEAWIVDPKNLDDSLIQTAIKLLDKADYKAMRLFIDERNEANSLHEELKEFKGTSNQQKLYEDIIEKINGKPTGFMVGKYLSSYDDAINDFWKPFNESNTKPTKKDFKKYPKLEDYRNPQWDKLNNMSPDNIVRRTYNYLSESSRKRDEATPDKYRLASGFKKERNSTSSFISAEEATNKKESINSIRYRLPAIEKNTMERLYEQGLFTTVKEGFKDAFSKDSMYIDSGEDGSKEINPNLKAVIVDEKGKQNQTIPIHYRGKVKKASQQSYDLLGISLMDYNMVTNYKEKKKVSDSLEIINDYASKRDIQIREGGKTLINKLGVGKKSYVTKKGIESESYKALNSLIQDRLYGISSIDLGDISIAGRSVSLNKLSNVAMGWAGNTMLVLNESAAAVNLLQGKFQNFLESATGNQYDRKNLRNAESLYIKNSGSILNDIGREIPTSITNLLNEKFDSFADFSGLREKFANDTKAKRLFNTNSGHFLNHSSEHYIQSTVMYAILDKIKVKDGKGNLISLHEAYEVVNGKLELKKGITGVNEDFEFEVSRKIKEVIKQIHGNYDKNNQAQAQRYVSGKFAFMLRKWMVVGTQRRWRGLREASKKKENRDPDNYAFNSILEENMEGYYSTFIRFMSDNRAELKKLQFGVMSGNWNELTDKERNNIRRTIIDISAMSLSIIASSILAGLAEGADDEDKKQYYAAAYLFRRFHSELRFYSDPREVFKILASPAASTRTIENFFHFTDQLIFHPTERYVRGDRKGELKLKRRASKLLPVFSQLDRNIIDTYKWLDR